MIKLVYRNDIPDELIIPAKVLPESGTSFPHHFQSTPQDNLIELAGRVCYDSCKSEKTRSSVDYHRHINDVNHGSVQEQCNLVFETQFHLETVLISCINRPGIWVDRNPDNGNPRITANIRAIKEWKQWRSRLATMSTNLVGNSILQAAVQVAPQSLAGCEVLTLPDAFNTRIVNPIFPEEIWLSFYIDVVSRGLSHEWVRHKFQTAISQRSTRYVDESESDWVWHPLMTKYDWSINNCGNTPADILQEDAKDCYANIVTFLEKQLISEGIDKFTARKQARGAARGVLGNSLATEMIWSGSLAQIIRIIKQRATEAADAEIRILAGQLYDLVQPLYPQYFVGTEKASCSDGIGFQILWKN